MTAPDLTEREKAIRELLVMLRSPIMLMCRPDRENAYRLAREHNVTALELLDAATRAARGERK